MLTWNFSTYAIVLLFSAGFAGLTAYYAWKQNSRLSRNFALLMIAIAIWSFADSLEAAVIEIPVKIFFGKSQIDKI